MSQKTKIEWTESTWNPISGCTKISRGCDNCYAEKMAYRLQAMGTKGYENAFEVTLHPEALEKPLRLKKSQMIFVNSMSDIFHDKVSDEFIFEIFDVMNRAHWHTFQVLTKRAKRLEILSEKLKWADNIWMGVSIESNEYIKRADSLRKCSAKTKFFSIEPLIGSVDKLDYTGIDWVIVGGESGSGSREMKKEWVVDVRQKCEKQSIPFFFKQWGGVNKKANGKTLDGKIYTELPNFKSTNLFSAKI